MKSKKYPTITELNSLRSFRFARFIGYFLLLLALFEPVINDSGFWYFEGVFNAFFIYLTLFVIRDILKYVVYGSRPNDQVFKKERSKELRQLLVIVILVPTYLLVVFSGVIFSEY